MMCLGFKKYGKPTANFASRRLVGLSRFSDLLQETEHFCRWPQKQVAKIVQCGEKIEERHPQGWPQIFAASFVIEHLFLT